MKYIFIIFLVALSIGRNQVDAQVVSPLKKGNISLRMREGGGGHVAITPDGRVIWYDALTQDPSVLTPQYPDAKSIATSKRVLEALRNYGFRFEVTGEQILGEDQSTRVLSSQLVKLRYFAVPTLPSNCAEEPEVPAYLPAGSVVRQVACTIGSMTFILKNFLEPIETTPSINAHTILLTAMYLHETARSVNAKPWQVYAIGKAAVLFSSIFAREDLGERKMLLESEHKALTQLFEQFNGTLPKPRNVIQYLTVHHFGGGIVHSSAEGLARFEKVYVNPSSSIIQVSPYLENGQPSFTGQGPTRSLFSEDKNLLGESVLLNSRLYYLSEVKIGHDVLLIDSYLAGDTIDLQAGVQLRKVGLMAEYAPHQKRNEVRRVGLATVTVLENSRIDSPTPIIKNYFETFYSPYEDRVQGPYFSGYSGELDDYCHEKRHPINNPKNARLLNIILSDEVSLQKTACEARNQLYFWRPRN